jgi:hypothetical protein
MYQYGEMVIENPTEMRSRRFVDLLALKKTASKRSVENTRAT